MRTREQSFWTEGLKATNASSHFSSRDSKHTNKQTGNLSGHRIKEDFLMIFRYYETCTRNMPDNTSAIFKYSSYWCPPEEFVQAGTYQWTGALDKPESFGHCHDHFFPPENECQDHYDAVSEDHFKTQLQY